MRAPHTIPPTWPDIATGRFASSIARDNPTDCAVAILGLPDDLGVRLNAGRPGAAAGPTAFRAALAKYGTTFDAARNTPLGVRIYDAGDIVPADPAEFAANPQRALDETHHRVREAAAWIHAKGLIVLGIGGGHDLTYPTVRALAEEIGAPVGGINVDAHLDVRETAGSGMGFRRLIKGDHIEPSRFVEYGIGRFVNTEAHVRWAEDQGVSLVDIDTALDGEVPMREAFHIAFGVGGTTDHPTGSALTGFVSIDLDAIDASSAPGVSALNPMGLPVSTCVEAARLAGAHPAVRHLDIMELNPAFDIDGRTARIAALLALTFIAGIAERA